MNTYLTISSLLNCFAALFLIANLLSSKRRNPVVTRFLLFLVSVAGWAGAYAMWRLSSSEEAAVLFCQILTAFSVFISVTLYDFCLRLGEIEARRSVIFGYVAAGIIVLFVFMDLVFTGVSEKYGHRYWPDAGPLMLVYLALYSGYLAASAWILVVSCRRNLGARASDSLFVLFVCFVGFVGGSTNFPLWFDIPIQPYGNGLVAIYVVLLGYGLYENRHIKVGVDFYKIFVGFSLNLSVALFYALALSFYRSFIDDPISAAGLRNQALWAFAISCLAFWGIPRVKFKIEKMLDSVFRKDRSGALGALKALPGRLSDYSDEPSILSLVTDTIVGSLNVSDVAVFRLRPIEGVYRCVCATGDFEIQADHLTVDSTNPLVEALSHEPQCLILDQIYRDFNREAYNVLVSLKNQHDLSLIVPIFAEHEVYGLIWIGPTQQPRIWTEEESSILFNLGAQIGLNFRIRDFERRAREIDKLVALGTMAAGLAHEIRNPLVSVQTMATLIKSGKSLDHVGANFRDVLIRDVKRIGNIVEGVAMYSQNQGGRFTPIDLREVVDASLEIVAEHLARAEVALEVEWDRDGACTVRSNFDQLVQVFTNLFENAIHAMNDVAEPKLRVVVNRRDIRQPRRESWAEVAVMDNGAGVPDSVIDRIFDPFITTKDTGERNEKKGMGLGLAISKRIMDNHGGFLAVQNMPEGGAKFVVSLKIFDSKEKKHA